jgi:hypothetical protein
VWVENHCGFYIIIVAHTNVGVAAFELKCTGGLYGALLMKMYCRNHDVVEHKAIELPQNIKPLTW